MFVIKHGAADNLTVALKSAIPTATETAILLITTLLGSTKKFDRRMAHRISAGKRWNASAGGAQNGRSEPPGLYGGVAHDFCAGPVNYSEWP